MKQWMIPVVMLLVGAGIAAGATLALTRPWQSEERIPVSTPAPEAASFTELDIVRLTQEQVGTKTVWPSGANWVRCDSASFRPDADMWVVTCSFSSDQAGTQIVRKSLYTVSDKDAKLVQ
jgi:hypothetical protein